MTLTRRDFLKTNAATTVSMSVQPFSGLDNPTEQKNHPCRIGVIGTGNRGRSLINSMLSLPGIQIPAVCDISAENLQKGQDLVIKAGQKKPEGYGKGELHFQELMNRDDLDAVVIATYWEWHTPMAVYAMKAGKYAAVEVPAAMSLEECWELVRTQEATGIPCMMLENWSFRRDNLAVLNMIRQGLLGEIVHCHCAHSHDCIDHWFFDAKTGMDRWAAKYLVTRNRDQYPTHQLGPVISWMDIGCGDYFDYLTSVSTGSRGINDYFLRRFGPEHPNTKRRYAQGDIVTTTVRTKKGKSIVINYDMQLPRPYDNRWMIQGTRGLYNEQRNSVYLTGRSPQYHEWESFDPYQVKYEHAWWQALQNQAGEMPHGGTDVLELKLFTDAARSKSQPPLDVYDAVIMSVTGPLSEQSIARGSAPVPVPDFTQGKWRTRKTKFAV